jgi:hypothetical protein
LDRRLPFLYKRTLREYNLLTLKNHTANAPVSLNEYQIIARRTDQNKDSGLDGLGFFLLGLFGEVGTLLSALKKKQRDRDRLSQGSATGRDQPPQSRHALSLIRASGRAALQACHIGGGAP